jgi:hypothetical protein
MKRLILSGLRGMTLTRAGRAEFVISFMFFRFAWGELPSPEKLAFYLAERSDLHGGGEHWSDGTDKRLRGDCKNLCLAEFCKGYDEIELWFDPTPTDQLQLIWLLDFLSSHPEIAPRLKMRLLDVDFIGAEEAFLAKGNIPAVSITTAE